MRDFSCFGDAAVTLASGGAAAAAGVGAGAGAALDRSLQAATASVYRVALSSRKELRIRVTWTRALAAAAAAAGGATGLAVAVDDGSRALPPPPAPAGRIGTPRRTTAAAPAAAAQHILQKKRGTRSFATDAGTAVTVYWDTAEAKYAHPASPEPSRDYHLAIVADGELALLLGGAGEGARDLARRFPPAPRRALLSRREQVRAAAAVPPSAPAAAAVAARAHAQAQVVHTTRCRFRDDGAEHEVTVSCRGDEWGGGGGQAAGGGEVAVSVDGKKVVEARRVKWNFRGNRTAVLGDGAVVEVMWDVHDWWFAGVSGGGGSGGGAQFMVKARGAPDGGRVWLDEEMASKGQPPAGFFLHLQCYRR
ncbi:unnamed protein product [Urochloa decumbens]|uniref:Uncharacterized protein n=1 Tax=Urochloa decumbens TaxID=240449 RepID=A0ABC9FPY3_9POAL